MNVANINTLIETLRGLKPKRFSMQWWAEPFDHVRDRVLPHSIRPQKMLTDCGTIGCIGGWSNALFGGRSEGAAAKALGLGPVKAHALFYPYEVCGLDWGKITRTQAIRVLEHLRDTGEVDWSKRGRR